MAISENLLLYKLSGHIAKQLVVKRYGDKTVVTKYPDMSRRKLSAAQKQVNRAMAEANYAAKEIMGDEKLRNAAQLRLNVSSNRLYRALIKEYFANLRKKTAKSK
jgi:hypothetical protein